MWVKMAIKRNEKCFELRINKPRKFVKEMRQDDRMILPYNEHELCVIII